LYPALTRTGGSSIRRSPEADAFAPVVPVHGAEEGGVPLLDQVVPGDPGEAEARKGEEHDVETPLDELVPDLVELPAPVPKAGRRLGTDGLHQAGTDLGPPFGGLGHIPALEGRARGLPGPFSGSTPALREGPGRNRFPAPRA